MAVTVNTTLAGPLTARFSNIYGALANLGLVSSLGAQDVTGSGDPVAPILNAAGFYAPLTSSLILTRGTGSPTYTRATNAWEFDNEGKLITVPSGSARFGGARMVLNYLGKSEDFSDALWSAGGITPPTISANSAVAPDGNATADKISFENAKPLVRQIASPASSDPVVIGNIYTFSCYVKAAPSSAATHIRLATNNTAAWNTGESTKIALTSEWQRVEVTWTQVTNTSQYLIIGAFDKTGTLDADCYGDVLVWGAQSENVTGQADQTASEYVSTGVLSAPYHGAGVDGVKWFTTHKSLSAISESSLLGYHAEGARTNSLLYSRDLTKAYWGGGSVVGSELISNGDFTTNTTGWSAISSSIAAVSGRLEVTSSGALGRAEQTINTTAGKYYVLSGTIENVSATSISLRAVEAGGSYPLLSDVILVTAGPTTTKTLFKAVGATTLISVRCAAAGVAYADNISVKEAAIQATTCTGIDNAPNSASTITAGAADATILQTLSLAAAARSFSAYVKRRTGTGSVYITRDGGTNWTDITSSLGASWTRVKIENTSVLNPSVGFKIATSGDAIDVDVCQDEAGVMASSPIVTTTAAVTRNNESLTFPTTSVSNAAGAILTCLSRNSTSDIGSSNVQTLVQFAGSYAGLYLLPSGNLKCNDGTNTLSPSPAMDYSNTTANKLAMSYGSVQRLAGNGVLSANTQTFDGSMFAGGANIYIGTSDTSGSNTWGYLKNIYIWSTALTDAQLQQVTA